MAEIQSGRERGKPYSGEKAKTSGKYILVGGFWPGEAGGKLTNSGVYSLMVEGVFLALSVWSWLEVEEGG